ARAAEKLLMRRFSVILAIGLALVSAGCQKRVEIGDLHVHRVTAAPMDGYLGEDANVDRPRWEGDYVLLAFSASNNLKQMSAAPHMVVRYDFFDCNAPDQWTTHGHVYASEIDGRYSAYIPADLSQLNFWVTGGGSGQGGTGWPEELLNEPLCFRLEGGVPYESTMLSNTFELPSMREYFEPVAEGPSQ
ncbi:MAG: hypothetical protein ABUS57_20340, partial [Pseudomonadota bacterium]